MKPFATNSLARTSQTRRSGVTIIEVLTSILIAVIGLFGVMVMIPFGVGQAEHGLRQEEASALALNAVSEFEMRGFSSTNFWHTVADGNLVELDSMARAYVIDPIGVADRMINGNNDSGVFPFATSDITNSLGRSPTPENILMSRVTIDAMESNAPMSRSVANQLFAWANDLVLRDADENDTNANFPELDLVPPQQQYDVDANDAQARRQSRRDMSYMVVAVPAKFAPVIVTGAGLPQATDRVFAWRNYFVVYEKRPQPLETAIPLDPNNPTQAYDRVFLVQNPGERVSFSGGDLVLTELAQSSTQSDEIRRDDWIMLSNVKHSAELDRFAQQIHFYKVVDSELDPVSGNWNVTLQGPDFDFYETADPGRPTASEDTPSSTYAIHLPDVWAVYERTFR